MIFIISARFLFVDFCAMISVEEAKSLILKASEQLSAVELPIEECYGYVLAKDIFAPIHFPPFNQSAMDGYAFVYNDLVSNTPIEIVGEAPAGKDVSGVFKSGQSVRIYTGAKVPEGFDCVVMQEKVNVDATQLVINDKELIVGSNIRPAGSQIELGELALKKGTVLSPGAVGYLSGIGICLVPVYRKPKVSIIVTGSELQKPGNKLKGAQIFESNSYTLIAALNSIFIKPKSIESVEDNEQEIARIIENVICESDVVLISGGISVGDYDFVGKTLEKLNVKNIFYKIKQKPGKPLFFGKKGNVLIFALPGNPAAVLSCFYNYVYPSLRLMQGFSTTFLKSVLLPISCNYPKKKGLSNFLKSMTNNNEVTPLDGQESYILSSFALADSMIYLPEGSENIKKNDLVEVFILP